MFFPSKVAKLKSGLGGVADSARGVRDVIKPIIAEAKTLPGKAKVNLAQSRAAEATISTLKPAGQTAVRSGVALADVKALYTIPKSTAANLKTLVRSVQKFAAGSKTANPLEVVGKPMIQGLKTAQLKANTIGANLGKVADKLPMVTSKQVTTQVFNSLKKVRGLEGLTVSKNGVLNFKNTTLATAGTKADRMAIQKIFTDAVKTGTGKQKHLLRQELFEILGGKKSGGLQITGTQERAFEAVRKGLSNTLDDLNPTYKSLNMQFAQTISPVKQLQKLLKSAGVDDDLLNMKAGILARRITSFAKSNPEIRQILRDLDKVIGKQGTTSASIEQLQDVYNILDKYYDIAGQTSFQGQVTAGVVKAAGGKGGFSRAVDLVEGQVGKLVGETSIVKQRAIEAVLKDLGLMN